MGKIISIGNRIGGVGKTTTTVALAFVFQRQGKKVLVIDSEGQKDAGELIDITFPDFKEEVVGTLYTAYMTGNIEKAINHVNDNLDLVRSDNEIEKINAEGNRVGGAQVNYMLSELMAPIKENYDYILIDLPPAATSVLCNNGIFASDYVICPVQNAPKDMNNTYAFLGMLQGLRTDYGIKTNLLGVLPWYINNFQPSSKQEMELFREKLGDAMFDTTIKNRKRINYFFRDGLTSNMVDHWDIDWIAQYTGVAMEIEARIKELDGVK